MRLTPQSYFCGDSHCQEPRHLWSKVPPKWGVQGRLETEISQLKDGTLWDGFCDVQRTPKNDSSIVYRWRELPVSFTTSVYPVFPRVSHFVSVSKERLFLSVLFEQQLALLRIGTSGVLPEYRCPPSEKGWSMHHVILGATCQRYCGNRC